MASGSAFVVLRLRGVRHGVPADVEAVRVFETAAEAEEAVKRLNGENTDCTVEYRWQVAVAQGNGEYAFGTTVRDADDQPRVPEHNQDQGCAFCGVSRPVFVHRLDPAHVEFRVYGKGSTFWPACARCEALVADGDDGALLRLMTWEDDDRSRRSALAAFRASDLGGEPLAEGPPDLVRP